MNNEQLATLMALNVDFLDSQEELELYAGAICSAIIWGENVK